MMCHEVTGNLAEKTSFLMYEARLAMLLPFFVVESSSAPHPTPFPVEYSHLLFPSSAYNQDKKQHELCWLAGWHTCADCLGQAQG